MSDNSRPQSSTVSQVIAALLITGLALIILGMLYTIGQNNREKVERMTTLCVENGHTGWDTNVGCFGGTGTK